MKELFTADHVFTTMRVAALVVFGIPFGIYLGRATQKAVSLRFSLQQGMVFGKIIQYGAIIIVVVTVFHQIGFSLTPLLGAAGIVGIALGFASQTSVSNIISGIFLIIEEPFEVGDLVTIGDTTGFVISVDILSVKLRATDNRFIRIPNESVIKNQVTNFTRFSIRRIDIALSVAYKEDIKKVREILLDVAFKNPFSLQEPEPLVIFSGFGNSSIDLNFAVWTHKDNFLKVKNTIHEEVKERFDAEGIEIPFPHLSLYSGLATEPFPIKIVGEGESL